MNTNKKLILILGLTLLFTLAAPTALVADEWDKATQLTFSEPVEVPGCVLPTGTYWFTLADADSDRNIVQIWNADRTRLITTVVAIPDYRLEPKGKTVVHFEERPSNQPEAIHSWFYPGANFGEEFVYPKSRATQLAKQVKRPVLSMPEPQPIDTAQIKQAPIKAVSPSGEEIEIAEIIESQPVVMPTEAPTTLPKTGSPPPLLLLAGLLSLGAAGVLRRTAQEME